MYVQPIATTPPCHDEYNHQDLMTRMSVVKLIRAIPYCFESMPECIQHILLEKRTEWAGNLFSDSFRAFVLYKKIKCEVTWKTGSLGLSTARGHTT